ncbi:MAG: nucleotidyltransferase domain-containing protein [Spirochaetaceae bacterium]|nr:MAG: nucleotidyltransferase domain-containing protein [Spirochaetaceae bacterium]
MRLSDEQRTAIRDAVRDRFGPDATVYLFGSRTDDARRGGDIDLLVELPEEAAASVNTVEAKLRTIADIQRRIGDRKIDLIVAEPAAATPIVTHARRQAVQV